MAATALLGNRLIYPKLFPDGHLRPDYAVKVQRAARPPSPWGWTIHVEGAHFPAYTSSAHYRSAHEAWEAGQKALAMVEQGRRTDCAPGD